MRFNSFAAVPAIMFVASCGSYRAEADNHAPLVDLIENGTLAQWRGYQQKDVPASWEIRDDSIFCNGKDDAHLITRKKYDDFELTGEWKISKGGNSGILLRVVEVTPYPANSGLEIQVIDHSDGWKDVHGYELGMGQSAGAVYGLYPANGDAIKQAGEWNTFRVRMQGAKIGIWHNDVLIVDDDMESEDWKSRLNRSKFAKSDHFNKVQRGHIALQNYRGAGVWYRNLRIREIPPENDTKIIEPVETNYAELAFYPDRWKQAGADFEMLAWEGKQLVFLTKKGDYKADELTAFVKRLDDGWETYSELIGQQPRQFKAIKGKPVICAIPKSGLSCGYGCGYVGATGIEASAFYSIDLINFQKQPQSFQHYYFYEMGRNYFIFGDRHSLFTTGFAVFMRYVCMDRLKCTDLDAATRTTIERCEEVYARSDIGFFDAFTNLGSGEKANRLRETDGRTISPSDQPVMYATAMLKLRRDYGGDDFVKRFYHTLRQCTPAKATDIKSAQTQVFNWLVCASIAASEDLSPVFADRWRMPLNAEQRNLMKKTDWKADAPDVTVLVSLLLKTK